MTNELPSSAPVTPLAGGEQEAQELAWVRTQLSAWLQSYIALDTNGDRRIRGRISV